MGLQKINLYQNKHLGETCFLILNGPSLKRSDIMLLKNKTTFVVNSFYKFLTKNNWKPTYFAITDERFYKQHKKEIENDCFDSDFNFILPKKKEFINARLKNKIIFKSNYSCWRIHNLFRVLPPLRWIKKNKSVFYDGPSIVYVLMQIIIYMGFKKIYILGADCENYSKHSKIVEYKNFVANRVGFDSLYAWKYIKRHTQKLWGIKIYNLTIGGKLKYFPRDNVRRIVKTMHP